MSSKAWYPQFAQGGIFATDGSSPWGAANRVYVKCAAHLFDPPPATPRAPGQPAPARLRDPAPTPLPPPPPWLRRRLLLGPLVRGRGRVARDVELELQGVEDRRRRDQRPHADAGAGARRPPSLTALPRAPRCASVDPAAEP